MVATICKSRMIRPDEVKSWYWRVLLRTYRQVGKSLWDEWISDVQKAEIGTVRAISIALGGKNKKLPALPEYDKVANDPWEESRPRKVLSDRMRMYHEANNIPIPAEYES